ncbi:hypothetical protein CJ030_MR5G013086 [Morella rubra]|uniref:Uncharacterized protein n=1 Tax=Morella rubra TaxID=262757 RepID=A0A6A1VJE3_9ROSI|nr:hypothetical protein CJ030_MR5G013086 [Morella rubra]
MMKLFEVKQILDMDSYVVVLKIRVWVLDNFEISVEHKPYLYLKDLPLLNLVNFGLVDVPPEPIIPYPFLPALPTECNRSTSDVGVIGLILDTKDKE